jgi:N-acyl-D-aspartate/D-glutamate deacylase
MLRHIIAIAALFSGVFTSTAAAGGGAVQADVVIRGATLYDGSGNPGQVGDLAIRGDCIVAVGKFKVAGKPRVLDATGLIIAPGFIDLHTHSDTPLTQKATSANLNYLRQGVTTVVTGNCGAGPVDVDKYFKRMEKLGVGSNVIHQVPHNAVRARVMGNANRLPSERELQAMEDLVDRGMREGAWGLSTGLIYNPGTYAKTEELIALAKVAARHGGFHASHIRNESTEVLAALEEILLIAHKAGLRVHISHIKVSGQRAWGKAPEMIALIRRQRSKGVKVTADQYPYIASSTSLTATVIPARFREGSAKDLLARLDDSEIGPRMKKAIEAQIDGRQGGKSIRIAGFTSRPEWQGQSLFAIAAKEKRPMLDVVLEMQRKGGASVVLFGMNEEEVRLFMREDWVATASDGASMVPGNTVPHPRSYGCFPRKIGRYAIEDKVIPLEQAIRSATGLPADILVLPQRGYLKPGYFADIVVFDPKTFRDRATFEKPHEYATGVVYLFVNGTMAIDGGRFAGKLAGKVLRHESKKAAAAAAP